MPLFRSGRRRPGWGGGRASKSAANCSPCARHRATRPCTPWASPVSSWRTGGCSRHRTVETENAGGGRGGTGGPLEEEGREEEGDGDGGGDEEEAGAAGRGWARSPEAAGPGESPGGPQKCAPDRRRVRGWTDCCCCCCCWGGGGGPAARLVAGGGTGAEQRPWPGGRSRLLGVEPTAQGWQADWRLSPC